MSVCVNAMSPCFIYLGGERKDSVRIKKYLSEV